MSFIFGKDQELSPKDVSGFRKQILDFIGSQGLDTVLRGADTGVETGVFKDLFAQRRAAALAQAKEQAGNLTGSGFANIFGAAAGRSALEENAFLASLMEQSRQASAQRFLGLIGAIPGLTGQIGHKPGFLDYALRFVGSVAGGGKGGGGGGAVPASDASYGGGYG